MMGPRRARCPLGRLQPVPIDVEREKRDGWRRHGILVVAAEDDRLTWPERELVRQLGAKLYGQPSEPRIAVRGKEGRNGKEGSRHG